ncbi:MAG: class I SAM-dependent methyltransferase [Solirubrobacterales bacterium]
MTRRSHVTGLRARIRRWLGDHPPAGRLVHETLFAKLLPRLAVRRVRRNPERHGAELARAMEAIVGRGIDPVEARWVDRIEHRRAEFAAGTMRVTFERDPSRDYSAGYIARVSSIHRPWGVFLMRLVRELKPRSCIELGTAIGISSAYQAAALELNGRGMLRTVEGSGQLAAVARETLGALRIHRVEVIEGRFDDVLDGVLAEAAPIDFAYLDAGKGRDHNLALFERLLPHLSPGAALIMDDVHWSREMSQAWREIRGHERVAVSVDLWRLGACLMRG